MVHDRYDIWEEPNSPNPKVMWRAQLVNYVGGFKSREAAESFVVGVKAYREKEGLK